MAQSGCSVRSVGLSFVRRGGARPVERPKPAERTYRLYEHSGVSRTLATMGDYPRKIRFGLGEADGPRSGYWSVEASARGDVYVTYSDIRGDKSHVSLHADPEHWHVKVVTGEEETMHRLPLERPPELVPGYTRALQLRMPSGLVTEGRRPVLKRCNWVSAPSEPRFVSFDLFLERAGANLSGWPGKNAMGTGFVGRMRLTDGGTAVVVSHVDTMEAGEATFAKTPELEAALSSSSLSLLTLRGVNQDGSPWLLLLRHEDYTPVD